MELINVKRYYPEKMPYGNNVQYFQSEDGKDFYDSLKLFTKKYKLCIHPATGEIYSVAEDVSMLYPAGFSVVEVDSLPEGFSINGMWRYSEGNIQGDVQKFRASANEKINAWRDRMESGSYTFVHNGRTWDYGKKTQQRLEPSIAAAKAGKLPDGFFWTDAENNDIPMKAEELIALSAAAEQAMFTKGLEIHIRQREMKKDVSELSDISALINYSPDWKKA
ncbi:DUF4376 domain-containing protein [Escherichia coli]